jgi:SAM-dependent methyltransferase
MVGIRDPTGSPFPGRKVKVLRMGSNMGPLRVVAGTRRRIDRGLRDTRLRREALRLLSARGQASRPDDIWHDASDELWLWINTEGLRRLPQLRPYVPAVAPSNLQVATHGNSGDTALRQGFEFYQLVRQEAERHNAVRSWDNATVLDYGCGWGRITRFFVRDVAPDRLLGLDCVEPMIKRAISCNPFATFQLIDPLPPTSLEPSSVDVVCAFSVFSHLSEEAHLRWLAEFRRVLRPGGVAILTTRPRGFITEMARLGEMVPGERAPGERADSSGSRAFQDKDTWLARYDEGEYCFSPAGGVWADRGNFYGEAVIPGAYVWRTWPQYLSPLEVIDDRPIGDQTVIVARRPPQ